MQPLLSCIKLYVQGRGWKEDRGVGVGVGGYRGWLVLQRVPVRYEIQFLKCKHEVLKQKLNMYRNIDTERVDTGIGYIMALKLRIHPSLAV